MYKLLTEQELGIYDIPKPIPSTQSDIFVYVFGETQSVAEYQTDIEHIFEAIAELTDSANCCRFGRPHLDLCGRQFGPDYKGEFCIFDADQNCFIGYFRYLRNVSFDLTLEDQEEHLKSFESNILVHDYPAFTPRIQSHASAVFGARLYEAEMFVRKQLGKHDPEYVDPYLQAYALVSSGFYVAPNIETFEEISDRLSGQIDDYLPAQGSQNKRQRMLKFKVENDEEQEEEEPLEEEKEEQTEEVEEKAEQEGVEDHIQEPDE